MFYEGRDVFTWEVLKGLVMGLGMVREELRGAC